MPGIGAVMNLMLGRADDNAFDPGSERNPYMRVLQVGCNVMKDIQECNVTGNNKQQDVAGIEIIEHARDYTDAEIAKDLIPPEIQRVHAKGRERCQDFRRMMHLVKLP